MDRFDDLLRLTRRLRLSRRESLQPLRWRPAADIYRTREGWLVKVELAGVREQDVDIAAGGRWLTIRGRRCDRECVQAGKSYALEIAYSRFQRVVEFPTSLEGARMTTELRNGMLLIRIVTEEVSGS